MKINNENIIKYINFLEEEYTDYIPLILYSYINNPLKYYNRISKEVFGEYIKTRNNLPSDYIERKEYLMNDLKEWIEKNPKFKDILEEE